jgi:hypothetical protein
MEELGANQCEESFLLGKGVLDRDQFAVLLRDPSPDLIRLSLLKLCGCARFYSASDFLMPEPNVSLHHSDERETPSA